MKIQEVEILEYNKSNSKVNLHLETNPISKISDPNTRFVLSVNHNDFSLKLYCHEYSATQRLYFFTNERVNPIESVVAMQIDEVVQDVWKQSSIEVNKKYAKNNFGDFLTRQVVISENLKLINDFNLSDSAENLWTKKLSPIGIYDKKLNQVYSLADIGKQTKDGSFIIHPKDDVEDVDLNNLLNPHPNMRFFLIFQNTHGSKAISEALAYNQSHHKKRLNNNKKTSYEEDLWASRDIIGYLFGD
jgi:hypothetical protein